jgi:hypothetical protein
MIDYSPLLARLAARSRDDEPIARVADRLPAPLSQDAIDAAERRLGFRLHPLLAAVYREIGNGGFGPKACYQS